MIHRLTGKRVLVVEDNPALAYDIDDALSDNGVAVVGPAFSLASGLEMARNHTDCAVLDIDIAGHFVWPLARQLRSHHIPFVFVSADCQSKFPPDLAESMCVDKPAPTQAIVARVSEALALH